MEKRIFVPELDREVVFDDSYPQEYVDKYIASEVAKLRPPPPSAPPQAPPQPQQVPLSPLGHLGALFAGIGRGVTSLPVTMVEGVGGVTGSETLKDAARGMRESEIGKLLWQTPEQYKDRYASTTGEIAGNLMSMLAPGYAATNVAKLPAWAGRAASVLTGMGQGSSEQVQRVAENRAAGMTITPEQETTAARQGSMTGLLEFLPYERLMPGASAAGYNLVREAAESGLGGIAKRALGTGAIEGATEALQQAGQNKIEQQYNPNQSWAEGIVESGGAGVGAGTILDLLVKGRGAGVARTIASRRPRLESKPIEALADVDSLGIRSDAEGAPIIEMLRRMQEATPAPTYVGPKESYKKPVVEEPALTPKEREALRIQQYQERMQRLIPDAPAAPIEAGPVENYKAPAQPKPVDTPEVAPPMLDEVIAATEEQQVPSVASEVAQIPATLTDEGTVVTPSNLAMDQPGAPKFSVSPAEEIQPINTPYTVESLGKEIEAGLKPAIALDVFAEMKRLGVDDLLSTRLLDTITNPAGGTSQGTYSNRIVQLALNGKSKTDLLRTLNHESVHAMQQMGLFTPDEWQILTTSFNPNTALSDYEKEQYGKLYQNDPARMREEAVARGIEKYALGQIEAPDAAVSAASKALGTVDRLGNVLRGRGFKNADDVMQAFRTGEVGSRPATLPAEPPAPRTMTDYEKGLYATKPNGKANQQVVQPAQDQQPGVTAPAGRQTDIAGLLAESVEGQKVGDVPAASLTPQPKSGYKLPPLPAKLPYAKPEDRGPVKKAFDDFVAPGPLGGWGLRGRQEALDRRAGVAKASQMASKKRGEEWDMARTSSEAAVRAYDSAMDLASSGLENGAPEMIGQRGDGYFKVRDDKHNAPMTVFGEAKESGKLDHLFLYIMGERSDVLTKQNKELKITPQEIAEWKSYGQDPQIKDWAGRWRKFNDDMIDLWQKSGRISAEDAAYYKRNFYLPYYRVEKDGRVNFQGSGASLATSPEIKKIQGSLKDMGDPIDNIVRNVNMITASAMKNEADLRIARDMMQLGFGRQVLKKKIDGKDRYVPASGTGEVDTNRLMHAWVDGKEKHFEVLDPILYDSIASTSFAPKGALKVAFELAKVPSSGLRKLVTSDPVFMVNNALMRDPTYVWLSGYSDFPLQKVFRDSFRAIAERPRFKDLERTGVVGNTIRGEGGATGTGRNLREKIDKKPHPLKKYTEFSRKSEAINRMTVYDKVMERTGGDEAQAQYEARELLNFGRHGDNALIQAINALVPFQNAAWQGADVLYRGAMGRGVNKDIQKTLGLRMMGLAGLSLIYTLLASEYDDWKTATAEERDLNYIGPNGFKFKIPFEAGYIAKVFPERLTAMYLGHDDGREFIGALRRFIKSTMKVDATPQAIDPIMEVMSNKDTFRDRSIEPEYMQKREKSQRFDERTSDLAKKLGEYTDTLSPLQIDHLIRGYFGGIGQYMVQLGSLLADPSTAAEKASLVGRAPNEYPVLGKFFQPQQGSGPIVDYYRDSDKGEQAKDALKRGLPATEERTNWAQYDEAMKPLDEQIKLISERIKQVRKAMDSGDLPAEEGRPLLREYIKTRNDLATTANKAARGIRGYWMD